MARFKKSRCTCVSHGMYRRSLNNWRQLACETLSRDESSCYKPVSVPPGAASQHPARHQVPMPGTRNNARHDASSSHRAHYRWCGASLIRVHETVQPAPPQWQRPGILRHTRAHRLEESELSRAVNRRKQRSGSSLFVRIPDCYAMISTLQL